MAAALSAATAEPHVCVVPMDPSHGSAIIAIQRSIYPNALHEDVSLILARASLFPAGSLVALDAAPPHDVLAYASAYPYPAALALASPPSLGELDPALIVAALAHPADACLFVHEVSVYAQGRGIGGLFMKRLLGLAGVMGLSSAVLVSVLGNRGYYLKLGFSLVRSLPDYAVAEGLQLAEAEPPLQPTPSFYSTLREADVMHMRL